MSEQAHRTETGWFAVLTLDSETVVVWSDEWARLEKESPELAAELAPLVESEKRTYTIRPYTFRERLEAETDATRVTDDGFMFDQWSLVSRLVESVTGITASELESMPASVGMRLWQEVERASQFPNLSLWRMRVSAPTASSTPPANRAPSRPSARRTTRSSGGASSGR